MGTQEIPGYYVWEAPGAPLAVHLNLSVIDGLVPEVMRGFGALPKRGVEVGGLLLGSVEDGVVRVEDFETVECSYKHGPSCVFGGEDREPFAEAWERWRPGGSQPKYAVGYFRSHTREGFALSPEDSMLLEDFFPGEAALALLIRPSATKPCQAGFFFRDNGRFCAETPLLFPFHRRELTGEEPFSRRPRGAGKPWRERQEFAESAADSEPPHVAGFAPPEAAEPSWKSESAERRGSMLPTWAWLPLAIVFLAIGLLLGYQGAVTMGGRTADSSGFSLNLSVSRDGENLTVRWNREAPAIRNAQRGVLEIEDGAYSKPVALDAAHLQNGTIIYRNSSRRVQFRLVVYESARTTIAETTEWRE